MPISLISFIIIPILSIIRLMLITLFLIVVLGIISPYIRHIDSYQLFQKTIHFEKVVNTEVKQTIPTTVAGYDLSRIITLIALFILSGATKSTIDHLNSKIEKRKLDKEFHLLKKSYAHTHQSEIDLLESKLKQANLSSSKDRRELLKEFIHIKKELEKIGRDLTFLSIDVVNSTGMKQDEDSAVIEHDFLEYHNFVEAKFKEHGYIKASWTPDGVMVCFNSIKDAVAAAQSIINELEYFNKNIKVMKTDFQIRCGVNGGFVYYDDSIPLEQFSDRTIDIAGHMQKHAPPNSILIAKQFIEPVKDRDHFTPTKRIVDGLEVYEWDKKDSEK